MDDDLSVTAQEDREAVIETAHMFPEAVAAALAPDNTDDVTMAVDDDGVRTRIRRPTTGGLRATVDDYLVNLSVAERMATLTTDATVKNEPHMSNDTERHTTLQTDDE